MKPKTLYEIYRLESKDLAFCPTGEGGGVDPTCSPGGGSGGSNWVDGDSAGNVTLYRGWAVGGQGHYFTPDMEWARQFTQSGQDHEIQKIKIKAKDIYRAEKLPTAFGEDTGPGNDLDRAIKAARAGGFKAVLVDEGIGQPQSVYMIRPIRKHEKDFILRAYQGLEPREALDYFRNLADFNMKGVIDQTLTDQIRRSLLQFMKGGKTTLEQIDQIRRIFEPYIGDPTKLQPSGQTGIGFPRGDMAPENALMAYRLENIIRTPMIEAFNEGRKAMGDAAGDYVVGYSYSAILDDRTTEICRFMDGFNIRKDDPRLAKISPPNHYQCRSVITFITTDDLPVDFTDDDDLDEAVSMVPVGFK